MGKNKDLKWIILIAAIVVVGVIVTVLAVSSSSSQRLSKLLDLGHRYLESGEYEQAIASFEEALTIDQKSVDAYLGESDAYAALEDYESAIAVLEKGYELTEEESLSARLEELKSIVTKQEEASAENEEREDDNEEQAGIEAFQDLFEFSEEGNYYFVNGEYRFRSFEDLRVAYMPWIERLEELIAYLHDEDYSSTVDNVRESAPVTRKDYENGRLLWEAYSMLSWCYAIIGDMEKCAQTRQKWANERGNTEILETHSYEGETYDQYGRVIAYDFDTGRHYEYVYPEKGIGEIQWEQYNPLYPSEQETCTYEYDESGRIIQCRNKWVDKNRSHVVESTREYNYQGDLVTVVFSWTDNLNPETNGSETYSFQVNEYGVSTDPEHSN